MFGYVRPFPDELKGKDLRLWREDYCGLCHCLGKRHGFLARFLLSYDMTFLYVLLGMDAQVEKAQKCWCPAGAVCKKACRPADERMEYAADLTVLLSYWKLADEVEDGGFFRRLTARVLQQVFRRAYRRAAAALPEADALIALQLSQLRKLEEAQSDSLDATADAFAVILRSFASAWADPVSRRVGEQLLYHIGRYVYLVDALDDLEKDQKRGVYNPIISRFGLAEGALPEAERAYLLQILDASVSQAGAAFELMAHGKRSAVIENIIYYGLPAVLKAVSLGQYRRRKRLRFNRKTD